MPRIIPPDLVEPVVRVVLGSIDTGDGGTEHQRNVLRALVTGYWDRPDLDLDAVVPATPVEAAELILDPAHRRRTRQFMVMLELCRLPMTDAQVARTQAYAEALGESGPGLDMMRVLVDEGKEAASAYLLARSMSIAAVDTADATFRDVPVVIEEPDPELVARLRGFGDLPEGTLGRVYHDWMVGHGFDFPGETVGSPALILGHDLCHVVTGYGPYGMEEIAVNAMQLGVSDTDLHWVNLVMSLALREAAIFLPENYEPIAPGTLDREGSAEMFADALRRGAECTGDFVGADLLGMAAEPLEDIRARYGIQPRRV